MKGQLGTELAKQPKQLDLYQMMVSNRYSNSVEFYQSLPDMFVWKQDKLRNVDWTLPVLQRFGVYKTKPYTLDISPANISPAKSKSKKEKRAFYKTVITEFVEYAIHKLAISDGFFTEDDRDKPDSFSLITTYYGIRQELKRMGKHYSYEQIKDGIAILAGLRYELSGEISKEYDINSYFSPIDLTVRNDRKNPLHSELYISFNRLISKRILALDWRSFNYQEFMQVKSSFGRTLFLRLNYRFQQADSVNGYHFKLSTLVAEWALLEDEVVYNQRRIDEALNDCGYLISQYESERIYAQNPETNRRVLIDYKVTIYPSEAFQQEQYRTNVHHKNIREHRITKNWAPVIKPLRDQYPTKYDFDRFQQDQKTFDEAKSPPKSNLD